MTNSPLKEEYKGTKFTTEKIAKRNYTTTITVLGEEPIILRNLPNMYLGPELGKKLTDEHSEKHWFYTEDLEITRRLALDNSWSYTIYMNGQKISKRTGVSNTTNLLFFINREIQELSKKECEEVLPIKMTYKKIFFKINKDLNNLFSLSFKENFLENDNSFSLTLLRNTPGFPSSLQPTLSDTYFRPSEDLPRDLITGLDSINTSIDLAHKIIDNCNPTFSIMNDGQKIDISKTGDKYNYYLTVPYASFGFTENTIDEAINCALDFKQNPKNKKGDQI